LIFPKVTRSLEEFWKNELKCIRRTNEQIEKKKTVGLCGKYTIWVKTLDPITLLHELLHYPIKRIHLKSRKFKSASIVLFLDFIVDVYEVVNGVLRYKYWRDRIHECINVLKSDFNDWLDWMLCRDVGV